MKNKTAFSILAFDAVLFFRRVLLLSGLFLLMSLLLGLLYVKTEDDLEAEYNGSMRKTYQQIDEYFRGMEQIVMSCYYQLATDSYVESWVQEAYRPQIDYYSLYLTYSRMSNIVLSHSNIESIYLYTYGNNKVLSTAFMFSDLEDFPHKRLLESRYKKQGWLPSFWERPSGVGAVKVIPLTLPVTLSVPNGQIVINVSEDMLMHAIPGGLDGILILNGEGGVLSASGTEYLDMYTASDTGDRDGAPEIEVARVGKEDASYYMLSSGESVYSWKIITFTDAARIDAAMGERLQWISVLCTVSAGGLVLTLAGLLFSRRLMAKQQKLAGQSLAASSFSREEEAIRRLLLSGVTGKGRIRRFSPESGYRVVIYEISNYYEKLTEEEGIPVAEVSLMLGTLRTFITERRQSFIKPGGGAGPPVIQRTGPDKLTVIYLEPLEKEALDEMLASVRGDMEASLDSSVFIAVSDVGYGEENVHTCYVQALQVLGDKSFYPAGSILYFNDMESYKPAGDIGFPAGEIKRLSTMILLDETEDNSGKLDELLEEIVSLCGKSTDVINAVFSNILFEMVKLSAENSGSHGQFQPNDIFIRLYSHDKIEEKKKLVKNLCADAAKRRRRSQFNPDNLLAQRIDAFIQENYDKEISLIILAEEFQINAAYISTLIKRELGLNFVNYISKLRVGKSVSLLKNTNTSVREIAKLCGYDDVHTYIRNFKKIHLTTPAEFRKSLWENDGTPKKGADDVIEQE